MLKKTKMFSGDPAPFVMELPAYHWPTLGNVLRSMWERGWSFIKKAGTIILLSTIFVWFTTYFGWVDGTLPHARRDLRSTLRSSPPSAARLPGSSSPSAGATGRPPWPPSPALSPRRTSSARSASSMAAATAPSTRTSAAAFTGVTAYSLPRLQPAVRPLLRGHRRDQARDEQRTSGPGSPSAISAASRM